MTTFICFAIAFGIMAFAGVFYYISHTSDYMGAAARQAEAEAAFQKLMHDHEEEPK